MSDNLIAKSIIYVNNEDGDSKMSKERFAMTEFCNQQ